LNPANALSASRLLLALLLGWLIVSRHDGVAVGVFVMAIATDLIDGPIARRRGEVSALGGLLDHGSDAFFVSVGLAALGQRGFIPILLAPLVALAFVQYMLDSRALAGEPLRASWLGRWNGIAYYVMLGTPIIRNLLGLAWPGEGLIRGLGVALLISTLASMLDRAVGLVRRQRSIERE
jgi:CDP-diacylglycerol--glycerol-3-phosphate 3-phosphatidyltransferase